MAKATKKTPKHIINGDEGNNDLKGNKFNNFNNTINAKEGDDTLTGGRGADRLTGGTGADTFVYTQAGDSAASKKGAFAASTGDTITDFEVGVDKIDLSALTSIQNVAATSPFLFSGTTPQKNGVWLGADAKGNTIVYMDVTDDAKADVAIRLNGNKALTANDFKGLATTTPATKPVVAITLDTISGGLVNKAESQGEITITGKATGDVKAGDTVTLAFGSKTVTGTLSADGSFTIKVAGTDVAAATSAKASITATNAAGSTLAEASQTYVVDVTPPAVPFVTTTFGTQETDRTPTISGTAEAGSTVILSIAKTGGATFTKEVTVGANGAWTYTLAQGEALGFGDYTLTAKARDAAGNESAASTADTFTLVDLPPNLGVNLRSDDLASGGIIIGNNGAFSNDTPVLSGSGVLAGHTLQVKIIGPAGDADYGSDKTPPGKTFNVTVNADGTWSFDLGTNNLPPFSTAGEYTIFLIHRETETGKVNPGSGTAVATFQHKPGTDGNDPLVGTGVADHLSGGFAADTLYGLAGDDKLDGGEGTDILDGGTGADIMSGGTENDLYFVDNVNDVVIEKELEGYDTVKSKISHQLADHVDKLILVDGEGNINGTGNELNNQLNGNDGNNNLFGLDGSDILDGGAGADVMQGGKGDDTYLVDNAGDAVSENANEGDDLIISTLQSTTLGVNLENLQLYDTAENGTGNALNNQIIGTNSNNVLKGEAGNDTLDGRMGADIMQGGTGDDIYYVDNANDVVTEKADEGKDTVNSRITLTLGADVEKLILLADGDTQDINGTGNDLNNQIIGNGGNNVLNGGAGDDVLTGGAGSDTLNGGAGYDTAAYDDAVEENGKGVTVNLGDVEAQNVGGGLGDDTLIGIEGLFGSQFDDTLIGHGGENSLEGQDGNDVLDGGGDFDWLYGGAGDDEVNGGDDFDVLIGGTGNDILNGGAARDRVEYWDAESMDEFTGVTVDLTKQGQSQVIGAGLGLDTLIDIEDISGSDFSDILTGDANDNQLGGNAGNDQLNGGDGDDSLIGGKGDDTLDGGEGDYDIAEFWDAESLDGTTGVTVDLAEQGKFQTIGAGLGSDKLTGIEGLSGSDFNDALTGDDNDNDLSGAAGDDTLQGGFGSDWLVGGEGNDVLNGGDDNDTASYDDAQSTDGTTGVTVDLTKQGQSQVIGAGLGSDTLTNIENLFGSAFNDILTGDGSNNTLEGDDGNDQLNGGAGDDWLVGGAGDDIIDGGINPEFGGDTAVYENADESVTVDLSNKNKQSISAGQGSDTLTGIENVFGSNFNDILTGDANNNVLNGNGGADILTGGDGEDGYIVDNVNDQVIEANSGGQYYDWVVTFVSYTLAANQEIEDLELASGAGNINATGNNLDNRLISNEGNNVLKGGGGFDYASWKNASAGVEVTLVDKGFNVTTVDGTDEGIEIDGLEGSGYADKLTGDENDNFLAGRQGSDILIGGLGADTLQGDRDQDADEADTFVFLTAERNNGQFEVDVIKDFVAGTDKLAFIAEATSDNFVSDNTVYTDGAALTNAAANALNGTTKFFVGYLDMVSSIDAYVAYDGDGDGFTDVIRLENVAEGSITIGDFTQWIVT